VLAVYDTLGCPKPFLDSVTVTVLPKVLAFAGNDTSVVINQPLQLIATGGSGYQWAPTRFLSNPSIANPIAIIPENTENNIRYSVRVSNQAGCSDTASLSVKVFNTKPGVFVPTAFTPNNDGLNEVLKPVIAGLQNVEYFAVFNRWGQRVFHSQNTGLGWDGTINGIPQPTGSFVWMFKAKDFTGNPYVAKGVVTLLR
jgi:gliding motility-associated-like protein